MNTTTFRVVFLSDTHLGIDEPLRPRVHRRRRGPDFFANYRKALDYAVEQKVDCVIHGGDILFRSKVRADLVARAFQPLMEVADRGIPVYVVPGNHERSRIPFPLLALHPGIFIFSKPDTFTLRKDDQSMTISGFPYYRDGIAADFATVVDNTGWRQQKADVPAAVMHHIVEGSQVGPNNFTFRRGPDIIRGQNIPDEFAAVLSGHIHRFQVLETDLQGHPLKRPVLYPGSIERTSFVERFEPKGFLYLELEVAQSSSGRLTKWSFVQLHARPMIVFEFNPRKLNDVQIAEKILDLVEDCEPDSIIRLDIPSEPKGVQASALTSQSLSALLPKTMNISVRYPRAFQSKRDRR